MTFPGNQLADPNDYTGLEDLSMAEMSLPRLKINHDKACFVFTQTGQEYPELYAVVLGLVKQRALWHPAVDEGDKPMCRSVDFVNGAPNLNPIKPIKAFPWAQAGFNQLDYVTGQEGEQPSVPCGSCLLKDWGSHPQGEKPYCSEQYVLPMLFASTKEELDAGVWIAALAQFQKTGIKPARIYLASFAQRRVGAFTVVTKITFDSVRKGKTTYCVPRFVTCGPTDISMHADFIEQFRGIRTVLTSPALRQGDSEEIIVAGEQVNVANPTTATERIVSAATGGAAPAVETVTIARPGPVTSPPRFTPQMNTPIQSAQSAQSAQPATVTQPSGSDAGRFADDDDDLPF